MSLKQAVEASQHSPLTAAVETLKGVGEDIAVTQESVEKIAATSDPEEAGKHAAVAGAAILDIAATIG
ncbi:MAG TPA: hypothetical protein VNO35_03100 [Steroidobacteraceae bacterium]|nr:hypothetical protein [Steroidobacteraceae bacterium]